MSDCKETFLNQYEVNVFFKGFGSMRTVYMVIEDLILYANKSEEYMIFDDECLWQDGTAVMEVDWRNWLFFCQQNSPLYCALGSASMNGKRKRIN